LSGWRRDRAAARRPGWLLDERASAGSENLDVDHVARYDAKEAWDASAEVRLLESLGLDAGSTVLDLGAGTRPLSDSTSGHCQWIKDGWAVGYRFEP